MSSLKMGTNPVAMILLVLPLLCAYQRAAAAGQENILTTDTNSLSIELKASTTNDGPVRLMLQPRQMPVSGRLFRASSFMDENEQAFIVLPGNVVYEGEVRNGKPDGQGTMTSPSGIHQWGEFRDGLSYKLTGTWVAYDGTREEGTWNLDGAQSGGTITWKDGRVYKGDWKLVAGAPERPDGMGTMTWPDGRVYVGEFRDGKMDGHGKMSYPSGKIEDGLWKQDQFAGPIH